MNSRSTCTITGHIRPHRIVSISQLLICPIIRGKGAADVEVEAKLDLSIVDGLGCIEKISFEVYNESEVLQESSSGTIKGKDIIPKES